MQFKFSLIQQGGKLKIFFPHVKRDKFVTFLVFPKSVTVTTLGRVLFQRKIAHVKIKKFKTNHFLKASTEMIKNGEKCYAEKKFSNIPVAIYTFPKITHPQKQVVRTPRGCLWIRRTDTTQVSRIPSTTERWIWRQIACKKFFFTLLPTFYLRGDVP